MSAVGRVFARPVAFAAVAAVMAAIVQGAGVMAVRPWERGAAAALGPPRFVNETASAGIAHTFAPVEDIGVGGGVAVFDCNGDGRPDLYLAGGTAPAQLARNDSPTGGALRFTPIGDATTNLTAVTGAYPLDVDGDGITDLAVLRVGGLLVLRGLGDCRFEPANERWGIDGGTGWATAFSATWERGAALPTLAVGNYLRLDAHGPARYACDTNVLLRPAARGAGYGPAIELSPGYCALSMLFSDWNRSGRRDLRISNDRQYYDFVAGEEQLWRVAPGEAPRAYTQADGWVQVQLWGMGIASTDLTADGYPEVYLTTQGANRLQTLADGPSAPTYEDMGLPRGANATFPYAGDTKLPSTAWHPEFADVNNDGLMDLFVTKGNVGSQADFALRDPSTLLIGQADGTFVEGAPAAGLEEFSPGRGAALADFNLDGLLDLVEVKLGAPALLWRNVGGGTADRPTPLGHWLAIQAVDQGPNRDAIGGWLEVRVGGAGGTVTQRELTIGGGHESGELGWIHVGLGGATAAEVRMTWPDGTSGPWLSAVADTFDIVERGAAAIRPWTPPAP
jgi:hypothetical protein